ncbi:KR domain-containing protein [Streptomyces sp. M10(2022)]
MGDEAGDPVSAPVWGLVRSAQSEHPDRFLLVDVDGEAPDYGSLADLAEPQLAVRSGRLFAPRLVRAGDPSASDELRRPWDSDGTVLITGGTGGLGAVFAEHFVKEYGTRHLTLVSRRGQAAEGIRSWWRAWRPWVRRCGWQPATWPTAASSRSYSVRWGAR